MLTPELVGELDTFRGVPKGTSICPAPAINLHFSQLGVVTACCFNRQHVLGVYPQNSINDIWNGEPIREIREALDRNDLSKGCEKCQQQIEARDFGGSHAVFYSNYAKITAEKRKELGMVPPGDPITDPRPMRLEFNIHNSCNLQCVMCHGLASSAIRTKREGLPAMANPYDDAFVDQLEPFFPHVVETDFMGGEPFLIPVYIKIWERIAQTSPKMKVCILTNGTTLTDRIKGILEDINCWMHISIDSTVKDTYESIRRGASYDEVMTNIEYYKELMERRGLPVVFRYCPMRSNWREIPETVRSCNDQGIMVMYNQVDSPINLSLHTLPTSELKSVVSHLSKHAPPSGTNAVEHHNYQHYMELVQRLEGFLNLENRETMLRARLSVSDAVVGQYTKEKRESASARIKVPELEESTNALIQAAKRYLTTRVNVDQASETEQQLAADILSSVAARRADLEAFRATTDDKRFVKSFLNEVIRTYSGVWGVSAADVHETSIFENIEQFAADLAKHPDRSRIIDEILDSPPGELYEVFSTQSIEEVEELFSATPS